MPTFGGLKDGYAATWRAMVVDDDKRRTFEAVARKLLTSLPLYQAVEAMTGVPAAVIMVIHEREGAGNFATHLHNGDPLIHRTVHVPAGRPVIGDPPFTWQESARDALVYENLTGIKDWSVERALFVLEGYNGFGYRSRGLRSAYLWGGTNQQQLGKYVADGRFDPTVMDRQLGCAGLLAAIWSALPVLALPMADAGPIYEPTPAPPPIVVPPKPRPRPTPPPPVPPPAPSQAPGAGIAALVAAIVGGLIAFRDQVVAFLHALFN